jgi:hypothetical protein
MGSKRFTFLSLFTGPFRFESHVISYFFIWCSAAKTIMSKANVPVVPGYHGEDQSNERLVYEAEKIG